MAKTHRVVDHIVGYLAATGVDYIFGVDGANIEDLYDAAHFRADITAILAKHEFSAATMADGYSRSGAGLGVVAATSGGGCLNTVAGLGEALASRVPVLALIGQPPTSLDGRGAFQDTSGRNGALNGEALFSAVSVFCRRIVTPEDIVSALPEAVAAAKRGGPAVLLLPKDIQQSILDFGGSVNGNTNGLATVAHLGDPQVIAHALRSADGPITIIAGEQVARDDARAELAQLRSMLRARVATVPDAKDVAGTPGLGLSSALGVTGVMGHPGVASAIADSALCLLVGTQLNVTARGGLDDALASTPTYSIGAAAPFVPSTHVHTEDLRGSLKLLAQALNGDCRPTRVSGCRMWCRGPSCNRPRMTGPASATARRWPCSMRRCRTVSTSSSTQATSAHRRSITCRLAGTAGSWSHWAWAVWDTASVPRSVSRSGVGSAAPSSIVIAGDGSFFMHGMEIHTAVQYGLPVTFLLFDNHAHAMCVTREQLFYNDVYSYNRFGPSRLGAGLAAMFPGLSSVDVDAIDDLPAALQAALEVDGPSVIAVECSADEIPPFAAFLNKETVKNPVIAEESRSHVVART